MAKYNRDFLIPYLQNVCALHFAKRKCEDRYSSICYRIDSIFDEKYSIERGAKKIHKPSEPSKFLLILSRIYGFLAILGIIGNIMLWMSDWDLISKLLLFIFIAPPTILFTVIYPILRKKGVKEFRYNQITYEREQVQFEKTVSEYNKRIALNQQAREIEIPALKSELPKCKREISIANDTLQKIYSANVIPRQYRNIYAAVYLYDWFSTSQADDLDMALNMFVLEEIKEKLDRIIENQMDIILNQRMMLTNQQRSLEQQQRHSNMMRAKLNQIAASNEERNTYLSMIESNTAATAYFAAADYIRKI